MKNIIKMSLVAAVAVAGFASTASAKPLEESIKNVDFSGSLRYRYTNGEINDLDKNQYRLEAVVKSKVNEYVTAKLGLESNHNTGDSTGDADPEAAAIAEANFIVNAGGATVIVGKQGLVTPFADSSLDSQQGTGIVALYPVGPVTLAAGWYNNTDAETNLLNTDVDLGSHNITALGVIGSIEMVNYSLWYANISESAVDVEDDNNNNTFANLDAGADAFNANVDAKFGPVSLEVNYAQVDYSASGSSVLADAIDDIKTQQSRVMVGFDAEVAEFTVGYIKAGKDGGNTGLGDGDEQANFSLEEFSANSLTDTHAYYAGVSVPVGPVTLGLEHARTSDVDGSDNVDTDFSETKFSVSYAMSKNFNISGWATSTSGDKLGDDNYSNMGATRIEVKYSF